MKKMLKKGAFALVAAMVLSGTSAFASVEHNIVDITENFDTANIAGWSATEGTSIAVNADGRLEMTFGENGGTVTKAINNANFNVIAAFDFFVTSNDDFAITLKNAAGEEIIALKTVERADQPTVVKEGENCFDDCYLQQTPGGNHLSLSLRLAKGDATIGINHDLYCAQKALSAKGEIAAIEFSTNTSNVVAQVDNFYLHNVRKTATNWSNGMALRDAIEKGIFNVTPESTKTGTAKTLFTKQDFVNNVASINIPAITNKGVIELDMWMAGDGWKIPCFGFGMGRTTDGGLFCEGTTPKINTPSGWVDVDLAFPASSGCLIRAEIDVKNKLYHIYANDTKSAGEVTYRGTYELPADVEYVDTLAIDNYTPGTHWYQGSINAWIVEDMSIELDSESVKASYPFDNGATLVLATYADFGDKLVDVELIKIGRSYQTTFEDLGIVTDGADLVKAFIIDNESDITPLSDEVKMSEIFN